MNLKQFDLGRPKPKHKPILPPKNPTPMSAKSHAKKKNSMQLVFFALGGIAIVSILQLGIYLSSARNASGEILGAATSAYADLNNASKNLSEQNLAQALQLFESASNNVRLAQNKLDNFKPLTWVAPQANSADHILMGAGYLAAAGEKLTRALEILGEFKVSSQGVETANFGQRLLTNKQLLTESRDLVFKSASEFDRVGSIPLDYEETLKHAKTQVAELGVVLNKLIGLEELYLGIFNGQKTYLLIFQNYDEQRATGGFVGTYGVLKTDNGSITKLVIDSIYDLDGKIYEPVAAPGPFQPDIKRWGIRDANWFADFPTSAKKLLYFFEKGQESADGVISLTPKIFEDLLKVVGPIEMEEYDIVLTAENFQEVVQYKTSVDYDRKENEPKKMLADFAPILLDRLSNLPQEQWLNFFQIMQKNLNQRHLMIYSKDTQTQMSVENLGFSGKLLNTDYDYLSIINTNLGGTKTDLDLEQAVKLNSKILSDGSIINTLTITRANQAPVNNKNYLRILVPLGSEFISATGFDNYPLNFSSSEGLRTDPDLSKWDEGKLYSNTYVRTESGKTEFAGWISTEGNSDRVVTISYMLPFKVDKIYSLLIQKQAGSKSFSFEGNFNLGKYNAEWVTDGVSRNLNSVEYKSNSNTDDFWGIVF